MYNYGARYYGPALGRYMTPDWSSTPTAVPYADFGNPQSLNLYTYGRNNPTTVGDQDGHCPGDDCKKVHVTVDRPEPAIVKNQPIDKNYVSGVGVKTTITFLDNKRHPMAGIGVKENPKTTDNLTGQPVKTDANPETATTSILGSMPDQVIAPLRIDSQPHEFTSEESDALNDAAASLPYNRTTDQTLTFSVGKQECQCTYSETLSNSDTNGNLNTQSNSNGTNFTFSTTKPVVQRVEPRKKDKEQK
jgi:RHS repeat-associated protein